MIVDIQQPSFTADVVDCSFVGPSLHMNETSDLESRNRRSFCPKFEFNED